MRRKPYHLDSEKFDRLPTPSQAKQIRKLIVQKRVLSEHGGKRHRIVHARSNGGKLEVKLFGQTSYVPANLLFLNGHELPETLLAAAL